LIIIISCYYFLDWTADYGRQQLNDSNQGYFGIYERAALVTRGQNRCQVDGASRENGE